MIDDVTVSYKQSNNVIIISLWSKGDIREERRIFFSEGEKFVMEIRDGVLRINIYGNDGSVNDKVEVPFKVKSFSVWNL